MTVTRSNVWKTSDGKPHKSRKLAKREQARLDLIAIAQNGAAEEDQDPKKLSDTQQEAVDGVVRMFVLQHAHVAKLLREAARTYAEDEIEDEEPEA